MQSLEALLNVQSPNIQHLTLAAVRDGWQAAFRRPDSDGYSVAWGATPADAIRALFQDTLADLI